MPLLTPDPDKQIDLDPSEWSRDEPLHQTFFTPDGRVFMKYFALMFVLGLVLSVPASIFVRGKAPYWIDDYITFEWSGLTTEQALIGTAAVIIVPFVLDIGLKILRSRRG